MMNIPQEQLDAMLAEANRACRENDMPRYGEPVNGRAQGISQPPDPEVFDRRDLRSGKLRRIEEFPMPGGKKLFVAASSGRTVSDVLLGRGSVPERLRVRPGDTPWDAEGKYQAIAVYLLAVQVTMICYRDPEGRIPCFELEDAGGILEELGYTLIKSIVEFSERLQEMPRKEDLESFFTVAARTSAMLRLLPACSIESIPGLAEALAEFDSHVSRLS